MSTPSAVSTRVMLGAYGWAYRNPIRKLFYNMTITSVSVIVAVVIGGIETLGLMAGRLGLEGPFWNVIEDLNSNFGAIGYIVVGLFAASWFVSLVIYRANGYDRYDERLTAHNEPMALQSAPVRSDAAR